LATVEDGFSVSDANTKLEAFAENDLELTDEYVWKTSGVNEENQNSVESIFQAMIISALLILATMVIQLGSFRKSVIVLLVIPLAISGVFIIFALTNTPLSFPALIGVLALFGIVVNNSIVIVEKINQNLKAGIKLQSAISDASASRVEPIMLSSLTTIMGLIPITISDPLWRGLGGAIISGLTVSGIIMLIFIPVVYYSWFKGEYK
jgi:multidrug efflux pump subunit AcrB